MVSKFVVDASALLALVNQEPGQEIVAAVLPKALVSAVNFSEMVAKLINRAISEEDINKIVAELNLTVMAFDEVQGLIAGQLRSLTRSHGLSLRDRACLALGLQTQNPVLTADRDRGKLPKMGLDIRLIR